jgi:hypothetical protein
VPPSTVCSTSTPQPWRSQHENCNTALRRPRPPGWYWADEVRRRKNVEAKVDDLGKQLQKASFKPPPEAQLKKMAIVLNDAHKLIHTVSKGLEKQRS